MVCFFFWIKKFLFYFLLTKTSLTGIALFRDRYILTIDSKAIDNQSAENCRLLLFDPNSSKLVLEENIAINRQSENVLKQKYLNHIHGRILPESTSKPRFIAVHNDDIYIADLGIEFYYLLYISEIDPNYRISLSFVK